MTQISILALGKYHVFRKTKALRVSMVAGFFALISAQAVGAAGPVHPECKSAIAESEAQMKVMMQSLDSASAATALCNNAKASNVTAKALEVCVRVEPAYVKQDLQAQIVELKRVANQSLEGARQLGISCDLN